MITLNNADTIASALKSLAVATDIQLVVDAGSSDGTCNLATEMGAIVIQRPWAGSHALQRQHYIEEALRRFDREEEVWLVVLDSDEILVGDHVRSAIASAKASGIDHLSIPRRWLVYFAGRYSFISSRPHFPDWSLRIFRLNANVRYLGQTHERMYGLHRGARIAGVHILHADFLLSSLDQREAKVVAREHLKRGEGMPRLYLFERFGYRLTTVDAQGYIDAALGQIPIRYRPELDPQLAKKKYSREVPFLHATRVKGRALRILHRLLDAHQLGYSWREFLN